MKIYAPFDFSHNATYPIGAYKTKEEAYKGITQYVTESAERRGIDLHEQYRKDIRNGTCEEWDLNSFEDWCYWCFDDIEIIEMELHE